MELIMYKSSFTLPGRFITLELLSKQHEKALCEVVASPKLWKHDQTFIPTPELMSIYIKLSLQGVRKGEHQKSAVNTEAKLILMKHAFESLSLRYIDFIVHKQNFASQKSLEAIGIRQNSSFSHLKAMPEWKNDEYLNYSVAATEWELIKENLQNKLFHKKL